MSQQSSFPMRRASGKPSCIIETKDISTQQSIKQSFITFQTAHSTPAKSSDNGSADPPPSRLRFLSVITESRQDSKNKFNPRPEEKEKRTHSFFNTPEAMCLCIPNESDKFLPRIKELRSMRQDLSMLIRSKAEEEQSQQGKNITPINSLLNLLQQP